MLDFDNRTEIQVCEGCVHLIANGECDGCESCMDARISGEGPNPCAELADPIRREMADE